MGVQGLEVQSEVQHQSQSQSQSYQCEKYAGPPPTAQTYVRTYALCEKTVLLRTKVCTSHCGKLDRLHTQLIINRIMHVMKYGLDT
jgi:hypothetical protein